MFVVEPKNLFLECNNSYDITELNMTDVAVMVNDVWRTNVSPDSQQTCFCVNNVPLSIEGT